MIHPEPSIRVNVDVTNPGQFFACCGLFELASRMDDQSLSRFSDSCFCIWGEVDGLIERILEAEIGEDTEHSGDDADVDKKSAIRIGTPFNLRLDWWREGDDNPDQSAVDAKMKTWSAGQKVSDVFDCLVEITEPKHGKPGRNVTGMRGWMKVAIEEDSDEWLRAARPIPKPKPFCFDSRLSRNKALDQGHTAGGTMAFSPAVDVLALVGLQRFRPLTVKPWEQNLYWPWRVQLPITVAPVAVLGHMPIACHPPLEYHVIRRDAAGKYKLIGHAEPHMETP